MIPLKLELKNFLSYPEHITTVDFKDYPLICLSGKNGNGKSALLDAITWAIWGQARKISGAIKPDSGLLRLGQTRMLVSLDFEFGQDVYRIRREYAKTYGKPYLALDLEVFEQRSKKFLSLTDKTVRLTQEKIENLLGLDYETFVNSAFLRQGLSDEFSKKSPKERKKILSDILGLCKYDELQKQAIDKAKCLQYEFGILTRLKEQFQKEIEKKNEIKNKSDKENFELKKLNGELVKLQNKFEKLSKNKSLLLQKKREYEFLINQKEKLKKDFDIKKYEFINITNEWKQAHYRSLNLPNVIELENKKSELEKKEKEYFRLQKKSLFLQDMILQTRDNYQREINSLKECHDEMLKNLRLLFEKKELEKNSFLNLIIIKEEYKEELCNKLEQQKNQILKIKISLNGCNKFNSDLEKTKSQFEKRRSFYQILIQKGNWIKTQLQEIEQKIIKVKNQRSPSCPLCEQVLTVKRKVFLGFRFEKELKFLKHRFSRISSIVEILKNILLIQHNEMKKLLLQDDEYKKLEIKKIELEKSFVQIEKEFANIVMELMKLEKEKKCIEVSLSKEKEEFKKQEKKLNGELENNKKIKNLVLKLEQLEKEKKEIKYNKKGHNELLEKIDTFEKKLESLTILKNDLSQQKERKEKVKMFSYQLKELKKNLLDIDERVKKLNFKLEDSKEFDKKIDEIQSEIKKKFIVKEKKLQELGSLKNELNRIKKFEKENKIRDFEINILKESIEDYQVLSQTFGKNGIQALLIEQAIPQIEEEANNILSCLTDNQSQVFIESLRDLKSGGVKETLDIQISDSAGIRPYEMFSGGEAFRVDFALRIAISKLLARRAGTALQTLIIDEGFGSQDEEGLSRLMDAIYAIKKDFSKVIVVSHLTNLKDNFPVHFLVGKDASGSFINVEQRG
ncbi:SMC family ATPase [Candidatus Babeliales bacterium]|nr:SMC family ATPase [Candidatus Babeliales bacterium]